MTTETPSPPIDPRPFIERLGRSGVLLFFGGLLGVLVCFLPAAVVKMDVGAGLDLGGLFGAAGVDVGAAPKLNIASTKTIKVMDDYRGMSCLFSYLAALFFAFRLYSPTGPVPHNLCWLCFLIAGSNLFCAVWMLYSPPAGGIPGMEMLGMNVGGQSKRSVGVFLNVVPALAIALGALFKAQEERLV